MRFGVIGTGNMAGAILFSIEKSGLFSLDEITVYDADPAKMEEFAAQGMKSAQSAAEVVQNSDIVLLSVKPQVMPAVLAEIQKETGGKCLLSIAAAIPTSYIKENVAEGTFVVRVMPNTPLMVGCGATAVALSPDTPEAHFSCCVNIFKASGHVEVMDEALIDPVTAVNGSSPAYFYRMAAVMAKYAVDRGISYEAGLALAAKAMEGAAKMIQTGEHTPDKLCEMVSSPGGTTLAALQTLDDGGFDRLLYAAMDSCTKRAKELSR